MSSTLALRRLACVARNQTGRFARPQAFLPSVLARLNSTTTTQQPKAKNGAEAPSPPAEPPLQAILENNSDNSGAAIDWSRSYQGLSAEPFPKEIAEILQAPVNPLDVEIKPGAFSL